MTASQNLVPPATVPVPTTPEEITAAWLSSVLGQAVTAVEIIKILPGTATKVLISVTYAHPHGGPIDLPTRFCIKGGLDPNMLAAIPWIQTLYDREVSVYTQLSNIFARDGAPEIPKCHWAGNGLLILQDLSSSPSSMSFGTPLSPTSLSAVMSGVEQLAALHAKTWGSEIPSWLVGQERHYDMAIMSMVRNYGAMVCGNDRPVIPESLKDQTRMHRVLGRYLGFNSSFELSDGVRYEGRYKSLLHGDAHVSNTYLLHEGGGEEATRFLDWQMVHVGSPFRDVAYFVVGAMDVETRREKEWIVVGHYLACLGKFGGPSLRLGTEEDDVDGVRQEYKCGILAGVGPIVCPYEMQPREWVFAMAERYATALDDHKVLDLMEGL
ncbi:Protein kinase-like domain containing protein [Rhypophila sp. PSN 637]